MGDKTRGMYQKFEVTRTDGSSRQGGKHYGCEYFVLDCRHDPYARAALKAYMDACRAEYPLLADDLGHILATRKFGAESSASEGTKP